MVIKQWLKERVQRHSRLDRRSPQQTTQAPALIQSLETMYYIVLVHVKLISRSRQ
jgi:hypothetical protein